MVLAAAVRAAADLDPRAIRRRHESGTRAQVILEQPAEAARLRHRQPARLGARAAGDVGQRPGLGEAEAGGREALMQRSHIGRIDPPEQQVLVGGDANRPVAVCACEVCEDPHLVARQVAKRNGGDRHDVAKLFLRT